MTCPKSNDCPFYNSRGDDWCGRKGTDCLIYDTWYNLKISLAVMEATTTTQLHIIEETKKRIGS